MTPGCPKTSSLVPDRRAPNRQSAYAMRILKTHTPEIWGVNLQKSLVFFQASPPDSRGGVITPRIWGYGSSGKRVSMKTMGQKQKNVAYKPRIWHVNPPPLGVVLSHLPCEIFSAILSIFLPICLLLLEHLVNFHQNLIGQFCRLSQF